MRPGPSTSWRWSPSSRARADPMPLEEGFLRPEEALASALDRLDERTRSEVIEVIGEHYQSRVADPGAFPFTRGIHATMYRGRRPTIRQFAGHGLAADTNRRFKTVLKLGGTGLSTAFDLPTLMGRDSDDPLSEGQVGWDGAAVDTLADVEDLFDGIPIEEVTVSMTINGPAAILLAMYFAMARRRGVDLHRLGGTTQNDILKEYIAQKEWLFPVERGVDLVVDTIEFCAKEAPKWNPVSISGYHIREAGASAVQELAYTLADGAWYVRKAVERGVEVTEFAPRALLLLRRAQRPVRRDRKAARGQTAQGDDHARQLRRHRCQVAVVQDTRPDRRRDADAQRADEQHHPSRPPGPGGDARGRPEHPHQLLR